MRYVASLAILFAAFQEKEQNPEAFCPMKTTEEGFYCEADDLILEKGALTDKGECWKCNTKPLKIKVCLRTYYACKGCTEKRMSEAECCTGKMIKKESRARIMFRCKGCGTKANKPTACSNDKCEIRGTKYAEYCEKSGTFPHGNTNQ